MLPIRNAMPCLYYRLKNGKQLGNSIEDYEAPIAFHGVFGKVSLNQNEFGRFQTNNRNYQIETSDLKLNSREMKADDMVVLGDHYDEMFMYKVISVDIGEPRVNFRNQDRNEREAMKRLALR